MTHANGIDDVQQMKTRRIKAVVWSLFGLSAFTVGLGLVAAAAAEAGSVPTPNLDDSVGDVLGAAGMGTLALTAAGLGAIITVARHENPGGRLLLGIGVLLPWFPTANAFADWSFYGSGPPEWVAVTAAYLSGIGLFGSWALAAIFALRFPTGEYMSGPWRVLGWITGLSALLVFTGVFDPAFFTPDPSRDVSYFISPGRSNPLAIEGLADASATAFGIGILGLYVGLFGGVVSLVVRLVRSRGEVRQQLKWVAYATVVTVVALTIGAQLNRLGGAFAFVWENVLFGLLMLIPISLAVALLKYRLYDIDVVINKTIVYAALATFITAVFAVVVFLPFLVFDVSTEDGAGALALPLVAAVILVAVIQPVRRRVQTAADRLVYGHRATPYETLSDFSASVAGSAADDELLERMAEIVALGTGAEATGVWLVEDGELSPAATRPASEGDIDPIPLRGDSIPAIPGTTDVVEVRHRGELLGAFSLKKRAGEPLRPIEEKLLDDLASQAGVAFRNLRLNRELRRRLEQLRASRQRLVSAQDEERRRLERDLHDGAQQQLVALKIKLGLAQRAQDPQARDELLSKLAAETDDAIDSLRELARGIYPPMLEAQGLVAALRAQAAKGTIPTDVSGDSIGRYSRDVEAAVYFCALEALQNVAKYARASSARVTLSQSDGRLEFEIADDGAGFAADEVPPGSGLQNMEDRVHALGGQIDVASHPGEGTTVRGALPATPRDSA